MLPWQQQCVEKNTHAIGKYAGANKKCQPYDLPSSGTLIMYIYGSQQPGCILCQKLVIFSFSLSNFYVLFWNVTVIMNICFIWQFCGQSINFVPVFRKKIICRGPPGAQKCQQEPKNYINSCWLWQILAEYGQLWMTFDDSGWLWQTLADSGYLPESARVSQSQPESARVSQSQPESARVCQSWHESAWVSHSPPESARVRKSQPESARVCQSQPESTRVSQSHQKTSRVGQSQPESARICHSKPEF